MPALPPNSLIVVTGISGYIASHTGLCALKAGHRVRGTVRSWARAESLKAGYEKQGIPASELDKRLEFVIVDDLSSEDQWTAALKDVDGVVHAALDVSKFQAKQLIADAIANMLSLLRAAKKYPSVKRVVITSSIFTVITPPMQRDKVLTSDDWDDEVLFMAENGLPAEQDPKMQKASMFFMYSAAKMRAEKAAWEFAQQVSSLHIAISPPTEY
jgi:nucleoside-diphosphate-sugar epimerase